MIRLRCDRCERVLEAPDDLAGRKIECPACGDVNVVPDAGGDGESASRGERTRGGRPRDRATAAGFPPDSGPETRVITVRPVMFRARPMTTLVVFMVLAACVSGVVYFGLILRQGPWAWACAAGLLATVVFVLAWKVSSLSEGLVITNKRTIERRGLLSRATTEVLHDDIRNVQVTQTFLQRLLRTGRLGLSSSAQDDVEIVMDHVPDPERVKRVIDLYRPL